MVAMALGALWQAGHTIVGALPRPISSGHGKACSCNTQPACSLLEAAVAKHTVHALLHHGKTQAVLLQALDEWAAQACPDFSMTVSVLVQLAGHLEHLHAAGLCHCDLKPANVLWRPRSNCCLLGIGSAACIGAFMPSVPLC